MVDLIKLEQKYLDLFNDKYNINPTAGKFRLDSKLSEATKKSMSKIKLANPIKFPTSPEKFSCLKLTQISILLRI